MNSPPEGALVMTSEPSAGAGARPAQSLPPAIMAVDLVKHFGSIPAVDGVGFDLRPGRIYGLLGPNGSGKTTLIRLLTGMTHPTSGHAEVLGVTMPSRPVLGRIGYMTQADGVYPALTVGENARFFAAAYGVGGEAQVIEALALVELEDRQGSVVATLSGGQRRRLSLACALIHRPQVLFLDEPTVGVDPLLRVQFWGHFRALADARHDDRRVEPRHGRGRPVRRAAVHAGRPDHRPRLRRRAPRRGRNIRARGRLPPLRGHTRWR
jgi:ABC-2 type transport system ATP-binding protein